MIIGIILALIGIITLIIGISTIRHTKQINAQVEAENRKLEDENRSLTHKKIKLLTEKDEVEKDLQRAIQLVDSKQEQFRQENIKLSELKQNVDNIYKDKEEMSQKAFENFCDVLDRHYDEKTEEYNNLISQLDKSYNDKQNEFLKDLTKLENELADIKKKRTAAIEAQVREKKIKENATFYCIQITDEDKADIQRLENIKKTLNKPRVLSMLIWQTWFQKPLKSLANNVIGAAEKTGIYKITNIVTNECYIGQAVKLHDRWNEHAKCGLGIDTPAGNKLYKAMQEYGLWSFSWEVLEECPKEKLNEREKYFIDLYDSYNYGYNSNKGVSK